MNRRAVTTPDLRPSYTGLVTADAPAPARTSTIATTWSRLARFLGRHTRGLTLANIVAQGGIIVTGGAVRLTGSGLGCSTWPQCEPGKFAPICALFEGSLLRREARRVFAG